MLNAPLIMDAESYDPDTQNSNPVGTGPYLVDEYIMNDHLTVVARDDYWGDVPAIKTIVFKNYNEASQITNALETGEVDIATVPSSDASYVETLGDYDIMQYSTGWCISAFYNMSPGAKLAEKDARYAINYAIDAESIISAAYDGYADPTDWPGSTHLVDYEPRFGGQIDSYVDSYNLEKAKELAEQTVL
jgi:peptide/nickel transport system substrate-binding protein